MIDTLRHALFFLWRENWQIRMVDIYYSLSFTHIFIINCICDIWYVNGHNVSRVIVTFKGKASHAAAAPWDGVNALDAAVMTYSAVSCMRQQMKPTSCINGNLKVFRWLYHVLYDAPLFIISSPCSVWYQLGLPLQDCRKVMSFEI